MTAARSERISTPSASTGGFNGPPDIGENRANTLVVDTHSLASQRQLSGEFSDASPAGANQGGALLQDQEIDVLRVLSHAPIVREESPPCLYPIGIPG
jgi:hypothetical protein